MPQRKKTKIVATIGPASGNEQTLKKMAAAGMTVARFNFSHGSYEEFREFFQAVRRVEEKLARPIAILQDLGGPKIRLGQFAEESVVLKKGAEFTLTTQKMTGDASRAWVSYSKLPREMKPDDIIMLDDGKKRLRVLSTTDTEVVCRVEIGGRIKGGRGVNPLGEGLSLAAMTAKDRRDLDFGLENGVDFVALSFVRRPAAVSKLRKILVDKGSQARIIAKIETREAIENLDEIIAKADGIMVARGDLAIELPAERVPRLQKSIIKKCNNAGKPVITATQMLESMIHSPTPTRAEVSDVANAVFDGTDAVMLSEETALGEYPLETVETMTRVAWEVERSSTERYRLNDHRAAGISTVDSVTTSVVETAHDIESPLIVAVTESGFTARMLSRHRPNSVILALTPHQVTWRQLQLSFGVIPILVGELDSVDAVFGVVRKHALKFKLAYKGDKAVVAAGVPFSKKRPRTNMMLVEKI